MMSETSLATESTQRSRTSWRAAFIVPVVLFLVLAVALAWGLTRDPRELPPALIGQPVPAFSLPPVRGRPPGVTRPSRYRHVAGRRVCVRVIRRVGQSLKKK